MDEIIRPLTITQTYDWLEVTDEVVTQTESERLDVRVRAIDGSNHDKTASIPLALLIGPDANPANIKVCQVSGKFHLAEFTEDGTYQRYHGTINLLSAGAVYRIEITRPGEGAIAKTEWTEVTP